MRPYIVGITGGSGSGKTTFIKQLMDKLGNNAVSLISQDNYYYPKDKQPKDEQGIENFDRPESINFENFLRDLQALEKGNPVSFLEYTFNNPAATPKTFTIKPAPILLIEGLFVFHSPVIKSMIDLKLFIDADESLREQRRVLRDKEERGYDQDDVLYRLQQHHLPAFNEYILPQKTEVDLVILNNTNFSTSLEVLLPFFNHQVAIRS